MQLKVLYLAEDAHRHGVIDAREIKSTKTLVQEQIFRQKPALPALLPFHSAPTVSKPVVDKTLFLTIQYRLPKTSDAYRALVLHRMLEREVLEAEEMLGNSISSWVLGKWVVTNIV